MKKIVSILILTALFALNYNSVRFGHYHILSNGTVVFHEKANASFLPTNNLQKYANRGKLYEKAQDSLTTFGITAVWSS